MGRLGTPQVPLSSTFGFGRRLLYTATSSPRGVLRLRDQLDAAVIGQKPLKECLVLALIAKEHVYVEGPPGAAKTLLAETASATAGLSAFFCQLHRDTRLSELVGDAVIRREQRPTGELIRSEVEAGGLLTAEVAVLDDISRAPGEALNVLLRLLNERRWHAKPIPLLTAIATRRVRRITTSRSVSRQAK